MFQYLAIVIVGAVLLISVFSFGNASPGAARMSAGIGRLNAAMAQR